MLVLFAEEIDATAFNEQESKDDEIVNLTTLMAGLGPDTDPLGIWTSVQTESDGNEKSSGDNGDKVEKSESSVETSAEENEVLSSVSEQMQVLNISQAKTASHVWSLIQFLCLLIISRWTLLRSWYCSCFSVASKAIE